MEYFDTQITRKLSKICQRNFDETLTKPEWDSLKFNKDKNVSGLKPIKCVKIPLVVVYLHGKPREMQGSGYCNTQDSSYFERRKRL